jgi:hypothetical protein
MAEHPLLHVEQLEVRRRDNREAPLVGPFSFDIGSWLANPAPANR